MTPQDKPIDPLDDLFGDPPLLKGEDKAQYARLRAAVEAELKPDTLFEKINVRDHVDKLWEERRLRGYSVALTESAFMEALHSLLEPICEATSELPADVALDYYSADASARKSIAARLQKHGITTEMIQAKAMQIRGSGLLAFDRMISNREASRRLLRKEMARRPGSDVPSPPARPKQTGATKAAPN